MQRSVSIGFHEETALTINVFIRVTHTLPFQEHLTLCCLLTTNPMQVSQLTGFQEEALASIVHACLHQSDWHSHCRNISVEPHAEVSQSRLSWRDSIDHTCLHQSDPHSAIPGTSQFVLLTHYKPRAGQSVDRLSRRSPSINCTCISSSEWPTLPHCRNISVQPHAEVSQSRLSRRPPSINHTCLHLIDLHFPTAGTSQFVLVRHYKPHAEVSQCRLSRTPPSINHTCLHQSDLCSPMAGTDQLMLVTHY